MSRPGKTIVIVLLVACAVIFIAIVWTALATDGDSGNSAPELASARIDDHSHAAVGVNMSGLRLPPAPQRELRAHRAVVTGAADSPLPQPPGAPAVAG
jgi:hypothetical protein